MSKDMSPQVPIEKLQEEGFIKLLRERLGKFLVMESRFRPAIDMSMGEMDSMKNVFVELCECLADCYAAGISNLDRVVLSALEDDAEKFPALLDEDVKRKTIALWLVSKTCELISQRGNSGNVILGRVRGEIKDIKGKIDHLVSSFEEDLG